VPDLENNARLYLNSLQDNEDNPVKHLWYTIELIDQMTRTQPGGEKAKYLQMARLHPDLQEWLFPMLGHEMRMHLKRDNSKRTFKVCVKAFVKRLLYNRTFENMGERHYWTFDQISLGQFLREAGFARVDRASWNYSLYGKYMTENLDIQDGAEYKPGSLYMEAIK
jgi:hypothetical protein